MQQWDILMHFWAMDPNEKLKSGKQKAKRLKDEG
jgi:hypothetical protein